jgi:hypothetical protein
MGAAPLGGAYPYGAPAYNPAPKDELDMLKQHTEFLNSELESVKKRMDELAKEE